MSQQIAIILGISKFTEKQSIAKDIYRMKELEEMAWKSKVPVEEVSKTI